MRPSGNVVDHVSAAQANTLTSLRTGALYLTCTVATMAIFVSDVTLQLGVAVGVLYVLPVLVSAWVRGTLSTIVLTVTGIAFTLAGFLLSPTGGVGWMVLANRGISVFVVSLVGVLVVGRKFAEQRLSDSEERRSSLVLNAPVCIHEIDLEGRLTSMNPAGLHMMKVDSAADIEGLDYASAVDEKDRARVRNHLEQAYLGQPSHFVFRMTDSASGQVRTYDSSLVPIRDDSGTVERLMGISEDVTERRSAVAALNRAHDQLEHQVDERTSELSRSNQLLRKEAAERQRVESALRDSETQLREQFSELENIYRYAPIGLGLLDTDLRWVRINERLAAINGLPVEDHPGRTLRDIVPEIAKTVEPIMHRVIESGEPVLDIEVQGRIPTEPETEGFWLTSYYPITSREGHTLGVSIVVQDISELKRSDDRARRHFDELAHVSRLSTMGQLATGIAHELNQPLAAITNYAYAGRHLIEAEAATESLKIHELFNELLGQSLRAGEIVQHLRAFVNNTPTEHLVSPVNSLISDVLGLMESEFRRHGVHPALALDAGSPLVCVDAIQIQQVILNLARNSLDAMEGVNPSNRTVTITSKCAADEVEIAVRDSGKGPSTENLEQVFDAFYTTKGEGMGMGLAISRSIVEAHGGLLWAEANPDGGMTFRFTLPVAQTNGDREV